MKTEEQKQKQREATKRYNEKNKDKIRSYYQKNKEKVNKQAKEWREKNNDRHLEIHKAYTERVKEEFNSKYRLDHIKRRAKAKGIKVTITVEYIEQLKQQTTVCPIFGLTLIYGAGRHTDEASAQLDRIDNTKGYVEGNVHFISRRANRIKNDATLEEIEALAKYLRSISANE